ncbi:MULTISPECIES: hypothetical protein [unclassified Streptomyces]|uniref:hypothetical protein n=1 Tax=unclassified Streptomyces TaxID=2593676 RepID=UPI002E81AED2|nr:hypothetical protein [Streptomyces sp. NBC_00562]WTD31374.1 hypothetical protein OHB03_03490 [Streptomyces sp. NBC_01643]WUC18036.1 hypothetical protein OHA33_03700 [Streptomyces sp. NBC_00562]
MLRGDRFHRIINATWSSDQALVAPDGNGINGAATIRNGTWTRPTVFCSAS